MNDSFLDLAYRPPGLDRRRTGDTAKPPPIRLGAVTQMRVRFRQRFTFHAPILANQRGNPQYTHPIESREFRELNDLP